ncbi:hypothetical protein D9M70_569180 [compost metagenome]
MVDVLGADQAELHDGFFGPVYGQSGLQTCTFVASRAREGVADEGESNSVAFELEQVVVLVIGQSVDQLGQAGSGRHQRSAHCLSSLLVDSVLFDPGGQPLCRLALPGKAVIAN